MLADLHQGPACPWVVGHLWAFSGLCCFLQTLPFFADFQSDGLCANYRLACHRSRYVFSSFLPPEFQFELLFIKYNFGKKISKRATKEPACHLVKYIFLSFLIRRLGFHVHLGWNNDLKTKKFLCSVIWEWFPSSHMHRFFRDLRRFSWERSEESVPRASVCPFKIHTGWQNLALLHFPHSLTYVRIFPCYLDSGRTLCLRAGLILFQYR